MIQTVSLTRSFRRFCKIKTAPTYRNKWGHDSEIMERLFSLRKKSNSLGSTFCAEKMAKRVQCSSQVRCIKISCFGDFALSRYSSNLKIKSVASSNSRISRAEAREPQMQLTLLADTVSVAWGIVR